MRYREPRIRKRGNRWQIDYINPEGKRRMLSAGHSRQGAEQIRIRFATWLLEGKNPERELERAKQYLIGIQAISLQRISARATALAFNELYGLGHLAHREYPERILKIKADDVARAAKKYLKLKAYTLAVVRPKTP